MWCDPIPIFDFDMIRYRYSNSIWYDVDTISIKTIKPMRTSKYFPLLSIDRVPGHPRKGRKRRTVRWMYIEISMLIFRYIDKIGAISNTTVDGASYRCIEPFDLICKHCRIYCRSWRERAERPAVSCRECGVCYSPSWARYIYFFSFCELDFLALVRLIWLFTSRWNRLFSLLASSFARGGVYPRVLRRRFWPHSRRPVTAGVNPFHTSEIQMIYRSFPLHDLDPSEQIYRSLICMICVI